MLKIILVLIGSVVVIPAAFFLMSPIKDRVEVSQTHFTIAEVGTPRPVSRPTNPVTAVRSAPAIEGTDNNIMRTEASAILSSLLGSSSNVTEPAIQPTPASEPAQEYTTRELQSLIAQVMADDGGNSQNDVASADPQLDQDSINAVLTNIETVSYDTSLDASQNDPTEIAILNGTNPPPIRVPKALIYKVRRGDSLARISYKYYGRIDDYVVIYRANRKTLKNPDDIIVGQKLIIPAH